MMNDFLFWGLGLALYLDSHILQWMDLGRQVWFDCT